MRRFQFDPGAKLFNGKGGETGFVAAEAAMKMA
jgi:hypothetical protein